tara:strand:- start:1614 stop:1973 length:360 start_codon:yes stop_codon:yes gene_type:complete
MTKASIILRFPIPESILDKITSGDRYRSRWSCNSMKELKKALKDAVNSGVRESVLFKMIDLCDDAYHNILFDYVASLDHKECSYSQYSNIYWSMRIIDAMSMMWDRESMGRYQIISGRR